MRHNIIFLFMCLSLSCPVTYGQLFKAVHIPDSILATMKIDGDPSDWNWVPEKYLITEQLMKQHPDSVKNFWKCRINIGWSDLNHKLYIVAKVTDGVFIAKNSMYYTNDCMQFAINADNEGGLYEGEQPRAKHSMLCALMPPSDENPKLLINVGPDWMQKQHMEWKITQYKNQQNKYETVYEMCLNLWDKWDNKGPKFSSPTELFPLKTIRLAIVFNDSDAPDETFVEWMNLASPDWWKNANDMPKLLLDMPTENGVSWHGIQYILNQ